MHHSSVSWEITLLYFFKLRLYMVWIKGTRQSEKFHTFVCSRKISPNLYFDRLLLLKVYKISAKKVLWWPWRVMQNLKKNWFAVSKMIRVWWILNQTVESLKILRFDGLLVTKVYNVWAKKVQRSYLSWH